MYHQIINTEIIVMKENPILKFVDKSTKKKQRRKREILEHETELAF